MRVLFLTPYFYPYRGGLENYVYNIAKRLVQRGHEVTVLCSTKEHAPAMETIDGITVRRIPPTMILSNTPIVLNLLSRLRNLLKNEDFDIINAHMPVTYFADIGSIYKQIINNINTPFIVTYHNDLVKPNALDMIARVYNATMLNIVLSSSDHIITPSPYCYFESPFLRQVKWKVSWIPPGVEVSRFEKKDYLDIRTKYGLPDNSKIVLFVGSMGRHHTHKGVDVLIRAFSNVVKEVKDAYLILVGGGNMIPRYKELARSLGVSNNVIFAGFVEDNYLPDYYLSSDVVVLPSITTAEGFGMVLIEGNAAKKPVIASSIGGMKYVVKHKKTGLLVPPKDSKNLADAIVYILQNERDARKMGINGRKMVRRRYEWKKISNDTEDLFNELVIHYGN
ncbi:glycosyltransferase family 4 protein [Thermococcus sp. 9N3]|uniref:glycosyltransferase family 4 protein n=1 Tax=Thermococcus sp. 9N3 TaxID=163002 RepID=UPI00142F8D6A|nr:glycosyltransferase family 4 protein [Thermococcus sp. 9N3]NJE49413.1 glycosyltransferase family 1 protein [Thermococcus sp. 9N3]